MNDYQPACIISRLSLISWSYVHMGWCSIDNTSIHDTLTQVGSMLGQRRRRWANTEPTLGERLVYAGWEGHPSHTIR